MDSFEPFFLPQALLYLLATCIYLLATHLSQLVSAVFIHERILKQKRHEIFYYFITKKRKERNGTLFKCLVYLALEH